MVEKNKTVNLEERLVHASSEELRDLYRGISAWQALVTRAFRRNEVISSQEVTLNARFDQSLELLQMINSMERVRNLELRGVVGFI